MRSATPLSDEQRRKRSAAAITALLEIARDLTASLAARDRYARLLAAVRRVIPGDAACLLRLEGDALVPVAGYGLVRAALAPPLRPPRAPAARRDPALARAGALSRRQPAARSVRRRDRGRPARARAHPRLPRLRAHGGRRGGRRAHADALDPAALDGFDTRFLATLGALAGAALRTTALIEALEERAEHRGRVARELQRQAIEASGGMLGGSPAVQRLLEEIAWSPPRT